MSKEAYYRSNVAWLSRQVDDGFPLVAWTTTPMKYEYPNVMRSLMEGEWAVAQVSDTIGICVCHRQSQLDNFCTIYHGHRGWPIEIQRMAPPPPKKVDYSKITREIVGDLR